MKLTLRIGLNENNVCKLAPGTMETLEIIDGDYVLIRGKKRSETVLRVVGDESVSLTEIWTSSMAQTNTFTTPGDEVGIESCHDIKFGKRVVVQLHSSTVPFLDASRIFREQFFRGGVTPVCKNNYIFISGGISGKYMDMEPVSYCLINELTQIVVKETDQNMSLDIEKHKYVGYDNIGGCSRQLEQIKEAIDLPLRHPELFRSIGVTQPRGILMYGPPGTGKTLIARAVANETGAFFFIINGPEVMSKMAGESEANLRKIFKEAERKSPSIIFIDEIDSLAPRRDKTQGEVDRRIVSQLLTLMDGLKARSNVIIIGATNRPNSIDTALRRYGRFDREINIGVPDTKGREEILKIHARKLRVSGDVNIKDLALRTQGYVGADLAQVCTEAAMHCIRESTETMDVDTDKPLDEKHLATLVVQPRHFERALRGSKPATMRESMVEIPDVKWGDIGGLEEVKMKMKEMIRMPIESPELYAEFGLIPPKGVLLYGPPGCGKTLMAKAIATECGANFLSVKGPEILSMWLGEAEGNIRDLFEKARQASPCIIFFDEIDSIAKSRSGGFPGDGQGGGAMDRILTQILTEMDGVTSAKQVFVVGATNRPEVLDPAILRPGRLDQLIFIPLPDLSSRETIIRKALSKPPLHAEIEELDYIRHLATRLEDCSGADIVECCQRAVRIALRHATQGTNPEKKVKIEHVEQSLREVRKSVSEYELQKYLRFEAAQRI